MGQKTHPYLFRIGIATDWKSKWYSDKDYVALVNEDWKIRDYLRKELQRGQCRGSTSSAPVTGSSSRSRRPAPGRDRTQGQRGRASPRRSREMTPASP